MHTLNYLPAPVSHELPVLQTSGFLRNTATRKSLSITTCCFCLIWKMLQLSRRTVSTNLGPVSRELNTFGAYFGCHKCRPIFKMTIFHFKSSIFFSFKPSQKTAFQNELFNGGSRHAIGSENNRPIQKKQQKE